MYYATISGTWARLNDVAGLGARALNIVEDGDVVGIETGSIGAVEHEVALLLRLAESARQRAEALDRSAYLLLGALAERGPLGIAALAEIFQVDLSTASRQTAAMESKGLVQRRADPEDARVSLLQITPLGRMQLEATREARRALFAEILDGWSERECREFGAYLARFNQAIVRRRRSSPADS